MSKYCPLADAVTNCTDNCKSCMSEEKLYTFYAWRTDDEGGCDVCKREEFSPTLRYHPESGPWARHSIKIGDFNTLEELAEIIFEEFKDCFGLSREAALEDAKAYMDDFREREEAVQ